MTARRWLAAVGTALTLAACSSTAGVATQSAQRAATPTAPTTSAPPTSGDPSTTAAPSPTTAAASPPTTAASTPAPSTSSVAPPTTGAASSKLGEQLDFGDAKTPRTYDDFLRAALTDIQDWWIAQFPQVYGKPFTPLQGKVYAGYPERTSVIPGCERRQPTTYDDIHQFSAFYCEQGDFMVYDDGADGLLNQLAKQFGPSILGVVFAHEFGHAVQSRAGVLERNLPTITTEQQADCFAGAWVAHVANGGGEGIRFSDNDVRNGLVAMIQVRDPRGVDQYSQGGHGSAFDRVGAYQVGFTQGVARCAKLIDDPLPLVPNTIQPNGNLNGNADFGYADDQIVGLVAKDLNAYWGSALSAHGVAVPALTVVPVQSADGVACALPTGDFRMGAVYCPATKQVFFDEPLAKDLYHRFGDFVVGYMLGGAWSDAAQDALASRLRGEQRLLVDDCMTGGWAKTIIPDANGQRERQGAEIEAGDLDEAIQAALVIGDASSKDKVLGTGFEQIAQFRQGVLDGLDACTAQIGG